MILLVELINLYRLGNTLRGFNNIQIHKLKKISIA